MCPPQTQLVLGLEMGPTWRKCIIGRRPKTSQTQLPVPFLLSIVKQCDQSSFCSSHALSVMMVCSPLHCVPTELSLLCFQLVISHEQSNSFIAFLCDAEFYGSSVFKVYQMREWPGRCQFCLSLLQRLREKQTNNKAKKKLPRTTTVKNGEFVCLAKIFHIHRTYRWKNHGHYPGQEKLSIAQRQ